MRLVIFDLDQTLVEVLPIHDESARDVFLHFFGAEGRITEVDYAGRSLHESFLAIAQLKGIPEQRVKEDQQEMLEYYDRAFVKHFPPDAARFILPGVIPLLESLRKAGHILMLYTGDSRTVAGTILKGAHLDSYFRACFFGTEVRERSDMIRLAMAEAGRLAGRDFTGKETIVIGDSIRDIAAARHFGARVIAVATGYHRADELRGKGPDYLYRDLSNYREVIKAIES